MNDMFAKLAAPFAPSDIEWRVGHTNGDKTKGMALAYIDARAVMRRLDEVVGPANWTNEYPHASQKTVCRISIKIGSEWIYKEDGAGDTDFEAEKGALSDAFKRAAVKWGIGRYLYDLESPWVPIEAKGKSHFITSEGKRTLEALLHRKAHPQSAPSPTSRKHEADPIAKAREWANNAHAALAKMKFLNELNVWLDSADNAKKMAYLQKELPDEFAALDDKVNVTADRLNSLVAG